MKKAFATIFLLSSIAVMGNEATTTFDKEVQGVNKEQLEIREIPTMDKDLENQKINSGEINIKNDNYQNQEQKIKVVQGEKSALEKELSQGVEHRSYWKYILGGLGVVALIIAL